MATVIRVTQELRSDPRTVTLLDCTTTADHAGMRSVPKSEIRRNQIAINDLNVSYLEAGSGDKVLLLLHGGVNSDAMSDWGQSIQNFSSRFRIIAPDLPGFGMSGRQPGIKCTQEYYLKFVNKFINEIGIEKPVIIGSSMGAGIGLGHALENSSSVSALILVDPYGISGYRLPALAGLALKLPNLSEWGLRTFQKNQRLVAWAVHSVLKEGIDNNRISEAINKGIEVRRAFLEFLSDEAVEWPKKMLFGSIEMKTNYSSRLHELGMNGVKTLIIHGETDPGIPLKAITEALAQVSGIELLVMKGCGHSPQLEMPEDFNRIVRRFLAAIEESDRESQQHEFGVLLRRELTA